MAEDKPKRLTKKQRAEKFTEMSVETPQLRILDDLPLKEEDVDTEGFELPYHVGPVFDIIRHHKTRMPLAVAIYGDWGSGKTTAMHWLDRLLRDWTEKGETEKKAEKRNFKTVWFYPWKYDSKEDVWRGLISEVILRSINVEDASLKTVVNAARRFGGFLGRSFVHALAEVTIRAGVKDPLSGSEAGVEVSLSSIQEILQEFKDTNRPEKAYLNEFEDTLKTWIESTIAEDERLVIFIDDLDRCMPDIALQVLEALKLYLNLDRIIFVVGVDQEVITELVVKYYDKLGLKEDKAKKYLAKMFQVEVNLAPREDQIEEFLTEKLSEFEDWKGLDEVEQEVITKLVLKHADRNPREVKRLLNSAFIQARGIRHLGEFSPAQGLQLFFVRQVLALAHPNRERLLGTALGDDFFGAWSDAVRSTDEIDLKAAILGRLGASGEGAGDAAAEAPEERHRALWELLEDEDLGQLMRIEFPAETQRLQAIEAPDVDRDSEAIVRSAIAKQVGKTEEALTEDDWASVENLDLSFSGLTDAAPLARLTGLRTLYLDGTGVLDLSPLQGLTALEGLYLDGTSVSDLSPLQGLTALEWLNLDGTSVSDLSPLQGLTALRRLILNRTGVSDLSPLQGLTALKVLYLHETGVSDLSPLQDLTTLEWLILDGTSVSDLSPLQGLTALQGLNLDGTGVSELSPLKGLAALQRLYLNGTGVSELSPLKGLAALQRLYLNGTGVLELEVLYGMDKLRIVDVRETPVSEEQVRTLQERRPDSNILSDYDRAVGEDDSE